MKKMLVIGGSSGYGQGIARHMAALGWQVTASTNRPAQAGYTFTLNTPTRCESSWGFLLKCYLLVACGGWRLGMRYVKYRICDFKP